MFRKLITFINLANVSKVIASKSITILKKKKISLLTSSIVGGMTFLFLFANVLANTNPPAPIKPMSESATFASSQDLSEPSNQPLVTILQIVEHPALDRTRQGIMDELKKSNVQVEYEVAQNNPALAAQIAHKFVSSSPTVMVGIPTLSTQALIAANRPSHLPIVFSSVTDPIGSKLVNDLKKPKGNISGVSNYVAPEIQFAFFKKILPNIEKIGVIYNPGESNSIALNEQMEKAAKASNLKIVFAPANTSAEVTQATQSLIKQVDAIFINNDNTALSAFDSITKIANKNKIPVFVSDTDMVTRGALAALGPNQYELGRQTAKIILRVLKGEKLENIPVMFPDKVETVINSKTASILKIEIPKSVLEEATTVVTEKDIKDLKDKKDKEKGGK